MEGSLLDAYRVLRTTNPSPYMFYFSGSDGEIVGASPETLVKLEDGVLHTFPLAGTRPRGATEEADKALEAELLADEKERSEHNMLVDLGRNDIGKISRIGTVEVEKYMSIERYSHVMHIGSTVRGVIREDADAWMRWMPSSPQELCREHRNFGPVRSSTNWKTIREASMEEPLAISPLPETWIPVSL